MISVPIRKLIIFLAAMSLYSAAAPVITPARNDAAGTSEADSEPTDSIGHIFAFFVFNDDDESTPVADMKMTCDECD